MASFSTPPLLSLPLLALLLTAVASAELVVFVAGEEEDCTGEIVDFSPCLPFVSSFPNNISDTAPPSCCDSFASTFGDVNGGVCLCYLLREPLILGFPVNTTRILSLTSLCAADLENATSATNASTLEAICNS